MDHKYLPHSACLLDDWWLIGCFIVGHLLFLYAFWRGACIYRRISQSLRDSTEDMHYRRLYQAKSILIMMCGMTHVFGIITYFVGGDWYWWQVGTLVASGLGTVYLIERILADLPVVLQMRDATIRQLASLATTENAAHYATIRECLKKLSLLTGEENAPPQHP